MFLGKGVLDRDDFFNIPELEVNPLGDRIIDAFFAETCALCLLYNFKHYCCYILLLM